MTSLNYKQLLGFNWKCTVSFIQVVSDFWMLLLSCRFQRQLSEPCLPFPLSDTQGRPNFMSQVPSTSPRDGRPPYLRQMSEPLVPVPPQGFKQELLDPRYSWARCSQHGPIPGCLPPDGHQARATRLLLWFWWGLSHFLEMYSNVHNLPGLHESCLGEGMECILCACRGLWLLALFSEVYMNKSMHTCNPWTFECKEETFWEGCTPHT